MNELIPIINEDEINAVDARLLHEFLEVKTVFADWIKRKIDEYGFNEDSEYKIVFLKNGKNSNVGRPKKEYHISIDMAKQLAMLEGNEKGKQARQYFLEVEKKYKALQKEISQARERNFQKAQMGLLHDVTPEDTKVYILANKEVNKITCEIMNTEYKKKESMNETELRLREDVLIRWVDSFTTTQSKSKANMITRTCYGLKQIGKFSFMNKQFECK